MKIHPFIGLSVALVVPPLYFLLQEVNCTSLDVYI
jgi:hypothetical protein